ncbi:hypothetical protein HYW42_01305 [Candidatus Daviesbacteria bacterium]|nr:hypothetical protein [Candidatus Daviesbacteria bacterium]
MELLKRSIYLQPETRVWVNGHKVAPQSFDHLVRLSDRNDRIVLISLQRRGEGFIYNEVFNPGVTTVAIEYKCTPDCIKVDRPLGNTLLPTRKLVTPPTLTEQFKGLSYVELWGTQLGNEFKPVACSDELRLVSGPQLQAETYRITMNLATLAFPRRMVRCIIGDKENQRLLIAWSLFTQPVITAVRESEVDVYSMVAGARDRKFPMSRKLINPMLMITP